MEIIETKKKRNNVEHQIFQLNLPTSCCDLHLRIMDQGPQSRRVEKIGQMVVIFVPFCFFFPPQDSRPPTVRKMMTWSHYSFQQLLIAKARESRDCKVLIVNEGYTTKTCGRCGTMNDKIGGAKTWKCPGCQGIIERDWNAGRNIFLRNAHLMLDC